MRFKQFLEAQVKPYDVTHHDIDGLVKVLQTHCKGALMSAHNGEFIYRGTRSDLKSGVYHPGSGERKSQNTENFYTVFLDTNPANKDFPKRSKSFIASTNVSKADNYKYSWDVEGTLLFCFPFDETEIGVVGEDDMWDLSLDLGAPLANGNSIAALNSFWADVLSSSDAGHDVDSLADMQRILRKMPADIVVKRMKSNDILGKVNRDKMSDEEIVELLIDALPKAYSYKWLGCTVTDSKNLPKLNEVWFSGKCVMVTEEDMHQIAEEFGL